MSQVTGSVLDVSYAEGIVDLPLTVKEDEKANSKKEKKKKKKKNNNSDEKVPFLMMVPDTCSFISSSCAQLLYHQCILNRLVQDETTSVRFSQGQKVDAVIELVKEDYLVVSISQPSHCVGFIANMDTNTVFSNIHDNFKIGMVRKRRSLCLEGTGRHVGRQTSAPMSLC